MATLMDMIMMQRQGMDDPRYAADMQAADLQSRFAQSQPMTPPSFAGGFSPTMPPSVRAPVMIAAPPLQMPQMPPAVPPLPPAREVGAAPGMGVPMPPPRPANIGAAPGAPMQLASAAPSVRESFMQRLLGGPEYQSNSLPVIAQPQGPTPSGAALPPMMQAQTPQQINFGNPDNPADFVRADRALMGLPEEALRVAGLLG